MWRRKGRAGEWIGGTCRVAAVVESERPLWVLSARRGRQLIDLASGPLESRERAEKICEWLNNESADRWDYLIERILPQVSSGAWG